MTEEQIEQSLQARLAALDQEYITSRMTPAEYRARWAEIEGWAQHQYTVFLGRAPRTPDQDFTAACRFV